MTLRRMALLGGLLAVTVTACATTPVPVRPRDGGAATERVYIISRGWHTEVGLAAPEIRGPLATLERRFPGVTVLTFGFGDRAYLTARRVTIGSTLRALFPGRGVVLATALRASPAAAFGADNVVTLRLTSGEVDRLSRFVWDALDKETPAAPRGLGDGPYPGSVFYATVGTYDAFHTCNTWTAEALEAAGLPVTSSGVIFAGQVMARARALAAAQDAAAGD